MGSASTLHLPFGDHMHQLDATSKIRAQRKVLNPSIGRVRRLIAR
jgi:hypothetical protein